MSVIDIIFLVLIAVGFYFGYQKGLLHQLVGFLSILISYLFAGSLSLYLHQYIVKYNLLSERTSLIISFLFCSVLIFLLLKLAAYIVEFVLKITFLNVTNRLAGGIFGVLKFTMISVLLVFLFEKVNNAIAIVPEKQLQGSFVYNALKEMGLFLISFL